MHIRSLVGRRAFIFPMVTTLVTTAVIQAAAAGRSAVQAPGHPAETMTVSTEAELQGVMSALSSNLTIVLAPGTYRLTRTLYFNGPFSNIVIRGATGNRNDIVLQGPGMTQSSYGEAPYGVWTGGGVQGITIADLTIRDFYHHGIIFNGGTQSPRVVNVRILDIGTQLIKSNPDGSGGVNNGLVDGSVLEYSTEAPGTYTNGVDVHTGQNWIIRRNVFRNITSSAGLAGPSILMWNGSVDTLTEANTFINCARGIAYGLVDKAGGYDHAGGIIRNNMIFRGSAQSGDVGIGVADSPGTRVLNNTVFLSGTYGSPIEYRFAGASGVVLANNLLDGVVARRDGASGSESHTLRATAPMFVDAGGGNLHLMPGAAPIDAGVNVADVTTDWDGDTRPQGAATDVGADEFVGAPALSLTTHTNGTTFRPGDVLVLTAVLTPGSGVPAPVDAYVVVRLPDGSYLSLAGGGLIPGLVPIARNLVPVPYAGTVAQFTVPAGTPPGGYAWLSALTSPGTLNLLTPIAETPFTIGQ